MGCSMESNCACGNESGSNPECERCRLIERVAELERENQELVEEIAKHFFDPLQVMAILECKPPKCTSGRPILEVARESVFKIATLTADNQRLRELLRECREYVPVDLQDFIKAAIGEGE